MNNTYQLLRFADIKHKLPHDCRAYSRNERKNNEFDDEQVLCFSGDTQLDNLDLDDAFGLHGKGEADVIFLILVEGNLTIGGHIYNEETDAATGLIVLGDLTAKNIVAGGQEIYVNGNLAVSELFWGDYNHGMLTVKGSITVHTFIATDYSFDVARFRQKNRVHVRHWLWDEQDILDDAALAGLLDEECLILSPDDDPIISRSTMLEYFKAGKPVIKITEAAPIPFVFESRVFNNTNLQRLQQSPLFTDAIPRDEDGAQTIEYWRGDDFKRVIVIKDDPYAVRIYFQQADRAVVAGYVPAESATADGQPLFQLGIYFRTISTNRHKEETPLWEPYHPHLPAHRPFQQMTETLWNNLLGEWSEMEYRQVNFSQTVTPEKIETLLSLPLVQQKYSNKDSDDEDTEGLWEGLYHWQFTQRNGKKGKDPRVSVFRQLTSDSDDNGETFEIYHFDIETLPGNSMTTVLYTQDGDGHDHKIYKVPPHNVEAYGNAVRYFDMMDRRMPRLNEAYLEEQKGDAGSRDTSFPPACKF